MYLNSNIRKRVKNSSKRTFSHQSHNAQISFEECLGMLDQVVKYPKLGIAQPSNSGLSDFFRGLSKYFENLWCFNGLGHTVCIEKLKPLVSNFYLDNMITNLGNHLSVPKLLSNVSLCNYNFIPHSFILEEYYSNAFTSLLLNRFFQICFLCIIVHLMRIVSTILCSENRLISHILLSMRFNLWEDNNATKLSFSWFIDTYLHIKGLTIRLYEFIYKNSYKILYHNILFKVYNNVKHLISRFHLNYKSNLVKNKFLHIKTTIHGLYNINITLFAGQNLNVIYASFTVIYVFLGWLLDYLSYIWVLLDNRFKLKFLFTFNFLVKHFIYGILYILWLGMGVISTNGIYYLILSNATSLSIFNIVMLVTGSIISFIASNFWFLYGNPTIRQELNIGRIIADELILPLLIRYNNHTDNYFYNIYNLLIRTTYRIFTPHIFNIYSSLRRSFVEWVSFLGMVFSTYGSWNIYINSAFYSISVIQNFFIWAVPSFIFGYLLIYTEELRPRFSSYYYGIIYISFWTSICFSTNSILVGYINVDNASHALAYLIPINFVLSFMYPLPLYRYNGEGPILSRLLHMFLFISLTGVTLLSVGTMWYIIYPM